MSEYERHALSTEMVGPFDYGDCSCGWRSEPCLGVDMVAEAWVQHYRSACHAAERTT